MKFIASAFSGAHARWFRVSVAPILLLTLLGLTLFGAGCSDDDGGDVVFPTPIPQESMNWLFDVYGTDANNVYACGNKGAMFHFDGTEWSYVELGGGKPLTTLWGPGDGTLYVAGHEGKIWRLTGGSWNSMDSGTNKNIYAIGSYNSDIHFCGEDGTLRQLNGNSWNGVDPTIVVRNPTNQAPEDTLLLTEDVPSLLAVNHYSIGGAYDLPDFEGERIGMAGTDGMVLGVDIEPDLYDWELKPRRGDQLALSEWVLCTTSSVVTLADNYLATSEGWLFHLIEGEGGALVWSKMDPDMTVDAQNGVRDMWVDGDGNLYMVLDTGELVFQTAIYDFDLNIGERRFFDISHGGLTSIWGADPENMFMTGFNEDVIYHVAMDLSDTTVTITDMPVEFPNKGGQSIDMFEDHVGLPRF